MYLFILNGKDEGKRIDLSPGTYIIGRSTKSDIQLNSDRYVSGVHAKLTFSKDENLTITDNESKNGTYILGELVKKHAKINPGDIFRIGHTFFKFSRRSYDRYVPVSKKGDNIPEAIVVVDIVGSSNIAQVMGDRVAIKVKNMLMEKLNKNLAKYPAEYKKNTGDGFMIVFRKVLSAVKFSIGLLKDISVGDSYKGFHIRIGIHFGETYKLEDGDRRGTNVDMAFRVESVKIGEMHQTISGIKREDMPRVDRIFISEVVNKMTAGKPGIKTRCIGYFDLKGFTGRHKLFEIIV